MFAEETCLPLGFLTTELVGVRCPAIDRSISRWCILNWITCCLSLIQFWTRGHSLNIPNPSKIKPKIMLIQVIPYDTLSGCIFNKLSSTPADSSVVEGGGGAPPLHIRSLVIFQWKLSDQYASHKVMKSLHLGVEDVPCYVTESKE